MNNNTEKKMNMNRIYLQKNPHTQKEIKEFIASCEESFEKQFAEAARMILEEKGNVYVALSGPTCAGKTTAAKKLRQSIEAAGRTVRFVSLDDFFLPRRTLIERAEREGTVIDLDSIRAVDYEGMTKCVEGILAERKVMLPQYDFLAADRSGYVPFEPKSDDIVIFEGIQAIYPEFRVLFKDVKLISIHINVGTDLVYNDLFFDKREIRLMRRLVRDSLFRGASAELTYELWDGVVINEDNNILPYEEKASLFIDSVMPYEINVLRQPLIDLLEKVPLDSAYAWRAQAILMKVRNYEPIDPGYLPENSLYHEFVG